MKQIFATMMMFLAAAAAHAGPLLKFTFTIDITESEFIRRDSQTGDLIQQTRPYAAGQKVFASLTVDPAALDLDPSAENAKYASASMKFQFDGLQEFAANQTHPIFCLCYYNGTGANDDRVYFNGRSAGSEVQADLVFGIDGPATLFGSPSISTLAGIDMAMLFPDPYGVRYVQGSSNDEFNDLLDVFGSFTSVSIAVLEVPEPGSL